MFTSAKEILSTLFEKYGLTKDIYELHCVWEKELGKLSKRIKMVGMKDRILLVKVDNPVYKQELKIRKREILRKLNDYFGYKIVEQIRFV